MALPNPSVRHRARLPIRGFDEFLHDLIEERRQEICIRRIVILGIIGMLVRRSG